MKSVLVLILSAGMLSGLCLPAHAQEDQYVRIYSLIQEGDSLNNSSQPGLAVAKYIEAQTTLQTFQKVYPDWNTRVVNYRLNYLAAKIAELSARLPAPAVPAAVSSGPQTNGPVAGAAPSPEKADLENQVRSLQTQVQQLQANNLTLEARLKEAFSAQPASVDPRELTRAQDRIRSIEKENALLKVSLGQQQSRLPAESESNTVAQLQQQLAEANHKLAEQTEKTAAAAIAAAALQKKVDSPAPTVVDAPGLATTQKALESANRQLAEQTDLASRLAQEKDGLQLRLKTLEANAEAMNALHAENEILKKQLADLKPRAYASATPDPNHQLAQAQAEIAALQSDKEILRLQTIALQERVKQLMAPTVAAAANPALAATPASDPARVKELERDKADLQKKLEAAQKQLYGRKGKSAAARIEDLTGQLEVLRARLGVYETQAQPYSPEELALMKPSTPTLASADPKAGKKSVRELPAGAAALVAEAQRDFTAKQYDQAEQKYLQVVRQDEKNTYTLANLATIQLQLDHLDDAEKHIQQALTEAPDDAYSLMVLGEIDIRRDKYDAALDALSRAAKLDPQNPEIENYLGLTLSQKGLRSAAETAFRKAIQLDPGYASAHHNLAVFYVTQKPPWTELARWHYKKAVAAGFPRNPDLEKMLDTNAPAGSAP